MGSRGATGNPQLLETILLQAPVECASAQPECLCCLARIAIVSGESFFDEECFHFFKTHFLETARLTTTIRKAKIGRTDLPILRHEHGTFDDMIEFSNVSGKTMLQ